MTARRPTYEYPGVYLFAAAFAAVVFQLGAGLVLL